MTTFKALKGNPNKIHMLYEFYLDCNPQDYCHLMERMICNSVGPTLREQLNPLRNNEETDRCEEEYKRLNGTKDERRKGNFLTSTFYISSFISIINVLLVSFFKRATILPPCVRVTDLQANISCFTRFLL
ncbi:hypothetical protein AVEN_65212-1 [Araneus ventricosus]|uniref:Uncharacterized protein n=1 Tax=Araneus ventricosus TaxID=182803 RepID=A0A4Y2AFX8_ARAVE|nr:hypothetical protein AVEN_65212-1 [Araneus ventricosus]